MKNFLYLVVVIIFCISCSPKHNINYYRTGAVKCISHDKMTITLDGEGQGSSISMAVAIAERTIVENLLFKGIPGSNQERPLINDEFAVKMSHPEFFKSFIDNLDYQEYVIESNLIENLQDNNTYFITQRMKLDLTNLRNYLVKQGVIKKFGL